MKFRALAINILAAATAALIAIGCVGEAPAKDIAAPDITKIALFFPVDGLVPGRGDTGTFADPNVSFVYVASHPIGTHDAFPIDEDGSFTFSILGLSGDVIEVAGSRDDQGITRGESVYVRVPAIVLPGEHFFCCSTSMVCVSESEYANSKDENGNNVCPEAQASLSTACASDIQCRELNKEILPISLDAINISQPDENGLVQVQGRTDTPGALMRMENRGKRSIGGYNPGSVRSVISDSTGRFRFKDVQARGDDELVFQTHDLLGYRSPEAPKLVPDAQLKGVDILGAYAFGNVVENSAGYFVVRVHPYGVDGRGICPDSTGNPTLCFTGGLTRQMVQVTNPTLQKTFPLTLEDPPDDALPSGISWDIATEGDPLKPTQRIVLVMDLSANAPNVDVAPAARFRYAAEFVRSLRKRDLLAIVSFGVSNTPTGVFRERNFQEIGSDLGGLSSFVEDTLKMKQGDGPSNVLKGIEEAAVMLSEEGGNVPGTIVVITMSDQVGDDPSQKDYDASDAFAKVLDKIKPDPDLPALYKVFVVGAQLPSTFAPDPTKPDINMPSNYNIYVKSIADFSGGRATNVPLIALVPDPLAKLVGEIGGSYSILFRTFVPCTGKDPDLEFGVTVNLPTGSMSSSYKGILRVDAAVGPGACQ